jgi:large subunit ribosomal protein L6
MSRVGKYPVTVPAGVSVTLNGDELVAKGKLGELKLNISTHIDAKIEGNLISVSPKSEEKFARAMWGTTRALLNNMVKGVSEGFSRRLEINGVGYRADVQGKKLTLKLGYSHDVVYDIPADVNIVAEKPTLLVVSGADRQKVGQVAAEIRSYRGPEPYKGKGIKYEDETLVRKEGKKK